jgi:hypothetical protein
MSILSVMNVNKLTPLNPLCVRIAWHAILGALETVCPLVPTSDCHSSCGVLRQIHSAFQRNSPEISAYYFLFQVTVISPLLMVIQ